VIKTQLLEPHWEKKAGEVIALERATLYGIVIYNNRRVNFGLVNPAEAREIFIREALVGGEWDTRLPFLAANRKLIAQVEELEHKSRRQDVLVDDELIHAFYDQQLPADVCSGASLERWYRDEVRRQPGLLLLTRDELMRHEAAGITSAAFPKTLRLGGVDCATSYLHEPGDAKDGLTVTVPIYALNQVSDERCEWLVPGMLKDKVVALAKTLHQRPRSRLVPLPDYADEFIAAINDAQRFGSGSLHDALLQHVRGRTQLDIKRADFKPEQLPVHLLMNFRIVDENGRQLGTGRNLAALKSELGALARSAFQALAQLKVPNASRPTAEASGVQPASPERASSRAGTPAAAASQPASATGVNAAELYTDWTFGELPELLEVRRGGQTMVGFPALIDRGHAVALEVFDEPEVASLRHREGLRRLVALQIRDALKYLEKNIPELQKMSVLFIGLGSAEELREQIIGLAIDRAFLAEPLPSESVAFRRRVDEGRSRLNLIASEIARVGLAILIDHAAAQRKLKDARAPKDLSDDIAAQLERLVGKRFLVATPWTQLAHLPRYLKGVVMRLDKWRADPSRDSARLAELRPIEQRYSRLLAERKGVKDARLEEFRWLLEELRISLFAQELRTPQPVSVKRLEKAWAQMTH
jgi:ATP-dependent helicase HrpA